MAPTMSIVPNQDLVEFATELATAAGDIALAHFGSSPVQQKADGSEVTSADLAIQGALATRIAGRYPNHAVIGEETVESAAAEPAGARYCWVIDPLDGTRNYVRRFPVVATSIAVMDEGRPVAAVIRWHHAGQLFAATATGPATLNGDALCASQRPVDGNLLVGAQLGCSHGTQRVVGPWLERWALRNLGATAVHLALVASGGLDAAFAQDCKVWDLAAGALMIERAGGKCSGLSGEPLFPVDPATCADANYPVIAGGPNAHQALLRDLDSRDI